MRVLSIEAKKAARLTKDNSALLKDLQRKTGVAITVSKDGPEQWTFEIEGEPADEWETGQVVYAVSLGFPPKAALKLLDDRYYLEVIDLQVILGGNDSAMERYKARVIGSEGKVKKMIEELSGCWVGISESPQIGIIGEFEDLKMAREGITRILEGSQHGSVFAFLKETKRRRDAESAGLDLKRAKPAQKGL